MHEMGDVSETGGEKKKAEQVNACSSAKPATLVNSKTVHR